MPLDIRLVHASLLKARNSVCTVGRFKFTVRRPTSMEQARMRSAGGLVEINLQAIQTHVIGWEGVRESDVLIGGADEMLPFDAPTYMSWIEERDDLWMPLIEHMRNEITLQDKRMEAITKNSSAPSTA